MTNAYHLTAESRAILAARAAEIRANLKRRRDARESPRVRLYQSAVISIMHFYQTPFVIGCERLVA